jgi:hypothetical protein
MAVTFFPSHWDKRIRRRQPDMGIGKKNIRPTKGFQWQVRYPLKTILLNPGRFI